MSEGKNKLRKVKKPEIINDEIPWEADEEQIAQIEEVFGKTDKKENECAL